MGTAPRGLGLLAAVVAAWIAGAGERRFTVEEVTALPDTRAPNRPLPTLDREAHYFTRASFFREIRDGRRFVSDKRGLLYVLDPVTAAPSVVFDFEADAPDIWRRMEFATGNATGFISFEFHPEFLDAGKPGYGKFYTIHAEVASKAHAAGFTHPFIPPGDPAVKPVYTLADLKHHTVISEWTVSDPTAAHFTGATRRELLRAGHPATSYFHPLQDMQFRPGAAPKDADYGQLYVSGGDWGFIGGAGAVGAEPTGDVSAPGALQRLDTLAGTMMRIDPRPVSVTGGIAGIGDYTVPADNPFANDGDPRTLGEIWAYGFRDAHRMAWDTDGTLIVSDVGESTAEEVNIVHRGQNYGWPYREGTFINGLDTAHGGNGDPVMTLPLTEGADREGGPYTYPIVQYLHDKALVYQAIAGGFVYRGRLLPDLQGEFVFGDMDLGTLYRAPIAQMKALDALREAGKAPRTATIPARDLPLVDEHGNPKILADFVERYTGARRTDLRFGLGLDGELYLITCPDGRIRRLIHSPAE